MRKSLPLLGSIFAMIFLWGIPVKSSSQSLSTLQIASNWGKDNGKKKQQDKLILLENVLKSIETNYNVFINYDDKAIENKYINAKDLDFNIKNVEKLLDHLLIPLALRSEKIKDNIYLISKKPSINNKPSGSIEEKTGVNVNQEILGRAYTYIGSKREIEITGTVRDDKGETIPGVNVLVKGTTSGTITDTDGKYRLNAPAEATLVFSYIGFEVQEIAVNNRTVIDVSLASSLQNLGEVVVTGYTSQKRQTIASSISSVKSEDLERVHGGSTVSTGLAGKLPGVSFRMAEGRPGASAMVQIRNMGDPLYVIDGIQQDAGQFNNLAPNDIETITVLKDASAAQYGMRAANGVVVVTTKRGKLGATSSINFNANYGLQNWTRFPETVNSYRWHVGKVEADMNQNNATSITPEELEKWKAGTEYGFRDFNWYDFIIKENAPLSTYNLNATGGSEKINYYISLTRLDQSSVLGREFTFDRTNLQSNVDAKITKSIKVGVQINGRVETRDNPGVPGGDDYWAPRFALFRNLPWERPYANDNPEYLNDIGHNETNWGYLNKKFAGYSTDTWRVIQTNFTADYEVPFIKGLTFSGKYSYYLADQVLNGHEYTYDAYTYRPETDIYERTGGSTNPWRERRTTKVFNNVLQGFISYNRTFGRHSVSATLVNERIENRRLHTFQHAVPTNNFLPNMTFSTMDDLGFADRDDVEARIGYVGRFMYGFADKYFVEFAGRRDASWRYTEDDRVGYFPSVAAGWRITEEKFAQSILGGKNILSELKLRASYGQMGDDNTIHPFAYMRGYNYNTSKYIFNGDVVLGSRDRPEPITNISWLVSTISDLGIDYELFNSKVTGSFDYFYRKRTGLRGRKYDVLIPDELGYSLPDENVNSDAVIGGEGSITYQGTFKDVKFSIGGNASYARNKFLESYKPQFGNSLEKYYTSSENRWTNILWGWEAIGQFKSQDEINNYTVDNDGQGNRTMLPGDIIYKDQDKDGAITGADRRPIGYAPDRNPIINVGLTFTAEWKGFSLAADFSGGTMYSFQRRWELQTPYQNQGNLPKFFEDRWHREDPFNPDSRWIEGKYPPLRFNQGDHRNNATSSFWTINVKYLRARTIEIGYSIPAALLEKAKIKKVRIYANGFNLFSLDNLKDLGVEPEILDPNGLQYPQNKIINFGVNLSL